MHTLPSWLPVILIMNDRKQKAILITVIPYKRRFSFIAFRARVTRLRASTARVFRMNHSAFCGMFAKCRVEGGCVETLCRNAARS